MTRSAGEEQPGDDPRAAAPRDLARSETARAAAQPEDRGVSTAQEGRPPASRSEEDSAVRVERDTSGDPECQETDFDRKQPPIPLQEYARRNDSIANGPSLRGSGNCTSSLSEKLVLGLEQLKTEELPDFVKQNDSTLTFPEKLVLMLAYVERMAAKGAKRPTDESSSIGWTRDGTGFVVRDKEHLTSTWLPQFFLGQSKFSSFVRKLYRWGFQKVNPGVDAKLYSSSDRSSVVIFTNESFRKDNLSLLSNMRSVTASKTRKESVASRRRSEGTAALGYDRGGLLSTTESNRHLPRMGGGSPVEQQGALQQHQILAAATGPGPLAIPPELQQQLARIQHGAMGGQGGHQIASFIAQNALLHRGNTLPLAAAATALQSGLPLLPPGYTSTSASGATDAVAGWPYLNNPSSLPNIQGTEGLASALQQAHPQQSLGLQLGNTTQQYSAQQSQDRPARERTVAMANRLLPNRDDESEKSDDTKPPP